MASVNFSDYTASFDVWSDNTKSALNKSGQILTCTQYVAVAANSLSQMNYGAVPNTYSDELAKASGTLRSLISTVLVFNTIKEIVTLRLFFNRKEVENDDGSKKKVLSERKNYEEIASAVCFAVFRILSVVSLLGYAKCLDLGKNASTRIGQSMFASLIAGAGISAVHAAAKLLKSTSEDINQKAVDLGSSVLDLSTLPIEFGFLMGRGPVFSLIGAGICLLAVSIHLIRED